MMSIAYVRVDSGYGYQAVTAFKMTFVCMNENQDQSNPLRKIFVSAERERPQTLSFSGKLRLSLLQVLSCERKLNLLSPPAFCRVGGNVAQVGDSRHTAS